MSSSHTDQTLQEEKELELAIEISRNYNEDDAKKETQDKVKE